MKEIVINKCFGGFGLSHKAIMRYAELKGIELDYWIDDISQQVYSKSLGREVTADDAKDCRGILIHYYKKGGNKDRDYFFDSNIERDDPILVRVVKEIGDEANGSCSELSIVTIPSNVEYTIEEYDGKEWIAEKHRTWG